VFVDRFVKTAIEDAEKIGHCRCGEFTRLLVALVDVYVTAENELFRLGVPAVFFGLQAIVIECVLDLSGGLIDLSAGEMTFDAPFDRFRAASGDPDRRMGL